VSEKTIEPWLREILRCPQCKGELTDVRGDGTVELQCSACRLGYSVDSGIPVLLVDLARRLS
jgi:uncharacterized protein YbaR (Trm112 family)